MTNISALAGALFVASALLLSTPADGNLHSSENGGPVWNLRSCDDLMAAPEFEVLAKVIVLSTLTCRTQKELHIAGEVSIRSAAKIRTKGLHFVVHPTGRLTIMGPEDMIFERAEDSTSPLFSIYGTLNFKAGGSVQGHTVAGLKDGGGLLQVEDSGTVYSPGLTHFTSDTMTVARAESFPQYSQDATAHGICSLPKPDQKESDLPRESTEDEVNAVVATEGKVGDSSAGITIWGVTAEDIMD